jgi:sulfoxide reductase heme-binding subunit YedZ
LTRLLSGRWAKPVVFTLSLVPLLALAWRGWRDDLGANPIEYITRSTGLWTLRFLLVTLAIAPLRKLPGLSALIRFRRMLGLFSFFYASLHLLTYVWLDKFFDLPDIAKDIVKRPFITAGFFAFLVMVPLAVTSTAGWIRRLGGRRWQLLHRLVYVSVLAGVFHYGWQVKSDFRGPQTYAVLAAVLLLWRVVAWLMKRAAAPRPVSRPSAGPN